MKLRKFVMISIIALLALSACAPALVEPTPTTGITSIWEETPTNIVDPTEPAIPTSLPTNQPATPAHPYSGLIFTNAEGFWLVNHEGQAEQLVDTPYASLSPDGRYVAYEVGDPEDIWILDRSTGENRNLTNTVDRFETNPQWWQANPDVVLFESKQADQERFGSGYPTKINLDGSDYMILNEAQGGPMSPSSDGVRIAYGCCEAPQQIYHLDQGNTPFYPESYGIPAEKMFLPAYSPDGNSLAWILGGSQIGPGDWNLGVGVFDLASNQGRVLHIYQPVGGTEFVGDLQWSPDGNNLAYMNIGEPGYGRAPTLWLLRSDGSGEINLGIAHSPVWSPDGSQLAYTVTPENIQDERIYILSAGSLDNPVETPYQGVSQGWIKAP